MLFAAGIVVVAGARLWSEERAPSFLGSRAVAEQALDADGILSQICRHTPVPPFDAAMARVISSGVSSSSHW